MRKKVQPLQWLAMKLETRYFAAEGWVAETNTTSQRDTLQM